MPFAVDLTKISPVPSYYTVKRGRTSVWGGSPVAQSLTAYSNSAVGTGTLLIDGGYRIVASGNIEAWTVYQDNATVTDYPLDIGSIKLVICYQSGTDFKVRAVAAMSRAISMKGAVEFTLSTPIAVQRNDLVGVWLKPNSKFTVGYSPDYSGSGSSNFGSFVATVADASLVADATVASISGNRELGTKMYAFSVRGTLSSIQDVTNFWSSDGAGDDAYGWYDFVSGTNAFPDANIATPANMFDATNSVSTVAIGLTGNVYYSLDNGQAVPVERFNLKISGSIPSDGRVTVYTSGLVGVTKNLASMQAVAAENWVEVNTFLISNASNANTEYHIGRLCTLVRIEIVAGSAANISIENMECRIANLKIINGQVPPHPSGSMKDRVVIDAASHTEAQFYTAALTAYLDASGIVASLDTSDPNFYDQIPINSTVYLRRAGTLGQNNAYKAVTVTGKNTSLQTLSITAPGESFNQGDFIEPAPWWYQFSAYNNTNQSYAVSNWISNHSCVSPALRTSTTYSNVGK